MTTFETRLRASLAAAAGTTNSTSEHWQLVEAKIAARSRGEDIGTASEGIGMASEGPADSDATAPPTSALPQPAKVPGQSEPTGWRRWRAPVLVAASVVLLAGIAIPLAMRSINGGQIAAPAVPGQKTSPSAAGDPGAGQTVDGLVYAHHPDQTNAMEALLEGTVVDADGCLAIVPVWDHAGAPAVPTFPLPSTDPSSLRIGDLVALGGGFAPAGVTPQDEEFVIPHACMDMVSSADGYFVAASIMEVLPAAPAADLTAVPVDTSMAGTAAGQQMTMGPRALRDDMLIQVHANGTDAALLAPAISIAGDGSPLGYVRVAPSSEERPDTLDTGGSYLFGAVPAEVDRLLVFTTNGTSDTSGAPRAPGTYSGAEVHMIVTDQRHDESGADPAHGISQVPFTDLADGWRAFAIQVWAPSPAITVGAFSADGTLLQVRQFSPNGAETVDLPPESAPSSEPWDPATLEPRFGAWGPNGADGPYVATFPDWPGAAGHDALFEGRVVVLNGCVVGVPLDPSSDDPAADAVTLVFPQSLVEPAQPPAIVNFDGASYADGDQISVGGGMYGSRPGGLPSGCPEQAWSVN